MHYTEEQARDAIRLYPHIASEMKLSGQSLEVYLYLRVRKDGLTASKVASVWGVSIQHANQLLKSLIKKGYIQRTESPQESGGYEFIYTELSGVDECDT